MQRVTAVPYYGAGACVGLVLGCISVWVQIIQLVPGLSWLANGLRAVLPQSTSSSRTTEYSSSTSSSSRYPKPNVTTEGRTASGCFAVMDAGSLGGVLCQMERPGGSSSNSSSFPTTPHVSFQEHQPLQTAAADAAVSAYRGAAAIRSTLSSGSRTPAFEAAAAETAAQEAAAEYGPGVDQQQLLVELRERLNSFPLDNLSPATTATALSLMSIMEPAEDSEYGGDDEPSGYELGTVGPVEGELDIPLKHSSSSILMQPATPTAPAGHKVAPAPAGGVPGLSLPAKNFPVGSSGSTEKFTPAGGSGSSPIVRWGSGAAAQKYQQNGNSSAISGDDSSSGRDNDTVPLTDSSIKEFDQQVPSGVGQLSAAGLHAMTHDVGAADAAIVYGGSSDGGAEPQAAAADSVGSLSTATLNSMAARPTASGSSKTAPDAATTPGLAAPFLASAAADNTTAAAAAATAAAALDAPRWSAPAAAAASAAVSSPRSGASVGSVHRKSGSFSTVLRQKQQDFFAALKTKVGKGRQQLG